MKLIKFVDLKDQWKAEKSQLLPLIDKILSSGEFVGGKEIGLFEKKIATYTESKYAVALNSGTDALTIGLHLLGVKKGDEVITPPNSFVASTASIIHIGAKPVFVDVSDDQNIDPYKIEKAITKKTKAIMPVHLTGRMCNMKLIYEISKKYNIPVIEDAAQSIGSKFNNKFPGHYSKLACYSAHPLKNLNAFGDSGYITTNNYNIAKMAKTLSNHGIQDRNKINFFGFVSRMDNLQAGILNFHLKNLKKIIRKRRKNAEIYYKLLNRDKIFIPIKNKYNYDTFHTFVIQVNKRKELQKYLLSKGVMTSIHYPVPIHLQPASKHLGYKKGDFPIAEKQSNRILSIPINQYLSENKIIKISHLINKFFN